MASPQGGSAARDRLLRRVRVSRWATGLGAAGLTAAFSVAAAHAFKGHDGHAKAQTSGARTRTTHARVAVPAPDKVPSIAADGSLQPPAQAPQAAPQPDTQQQQPAPAPEQAPPVSGGS
jgi:hypothetical protein